MSDEDDDINLGRKLARALQEEKELKSQTRMTNRLARGFVILVIVLGIITFILINLGGPK